MYTRQLAQVIKRFTQFYPVIGITGPRQSGKTTLAKQLFEQLAYVSLENLDTRLQAQQDPRAFLARYQAGAIFDEVQNAPELLSYMQQMVDESPHKGRFVLTGSQYFALSQQITQSLSGRIGMTTLLPLSLAELNKPKDIWQSLFQGGYPRLHDLNISPLDFYPSYIQTYLERDVRQIKNIGDFGRFQIFLKLCAGRVGQIINYTSLAQDCGVSATTVRQWLTVLEASYLIFLLQPYYQNFNKRLIKMPKLYFYDTGLACTLLGLEQASQVTTHYLKGALYENLVILELLKNRLNRGLPANLYFWRDRAGREIDVIAEWGGAIKAIEIKASQTFQTDFIKNLAYFNDLAKTVQSYLIYDGTEEGQFANITLLPLRRIERVFEE